jgi:hypothetical protein
MFLLLLYYFPLSGIVTVPLGIYLLYESLNAAPSSKTYQGAGWICDSSKPYQERCHDDPTLLPDGKHSYKTKQICENSCLAEEEKYPSVENILKFTQNINFPIPRDFLLQIEADPAEYHKFMASGTYDLVSDMINFAGLREQVSQDIANTYQDKYKINVERLECYVLKMGRKYNTKLLDKALMVLKDPSDPMYHAYSAYLHGGYPDSYNFHQEFNEAWPNIAKDIGLISDAPLFPEREKLVHPPGYDMTLVNIGMAGDFKHATFLLLDHKTMKASYFDSNLEVISPVYNRLQHMFREYDFSHPTFEGCPIGLQGAENKDMIDAYCQTWSLFAQHLYLANHGKPVQEFLGYLLSIQKYALDILFAYSFYLFTSYKNSTIGRENSNNIFICESQVRNIENMKKMLRGLLPLTTDETYRNYIFFLMGIGRTLIKIFADILNPHTYKTIPLGRQMISLSDMLGEESTQVFKAMKGEIILDPLQDCIKKWEDVEQSLPEYLREYMKDYIETFKRKVASSSKMSTCTLF